MKGKLKLAIALIALTIVSSTIISVFVNIDKELTSDAEVISMQTELLGDEQVEKSFESDGEIYTPKENTAIDNIEVHKILSESSGMRDKLTIVCLIIVVCCIIVLWIADTIKKRAENSWKYRF